MELQAFLEKEGRGASAALARKINVPPVLITQWKKGIQRVPADKCLLLEAATNGAVRCEELRPDISWFVIRGQMPNQSLKSEPK